MTDITFADISDLQPSFNPPAYIAGGHKVILARAHNGHRPDNQWPDRRNQLRKAPFTAVGYYQYLAASRDAAAQARDYIATVGQLLPNEFAILDLEEGAGNQIPRAETWLRIVDGWAGFMSTLYTGDSFLRSNLGGPGHWGRRPLWVASYPAGYRPTPSQEPKLATFWQYSDRERFPGLPSPVDGSIYHGDDHAFLARVRPGARSPAPLQPRDDDTIEVVRTGEHTELFVQRATGEVFHVWQRTQSGAWSGWSSLGKPGG